MSTKQIAVRLAGQKRIVDVELSEETTADDVLETVGCPEDYYLLPAVGQPPFGSDEKLFERVADGGKIIAAPKSDAGE